MRCEEQFAERGALSDLAFVYGQLSDVTWELGDATAALDWVDKALAHAQLCGEQRNDDRHQVRKARLLYAVGDYAAAIAVNRNLVERSPDGDVVLWAYLRWADLLRVAEGPRATIDLLKEIRAFFRSDRAPETLVEQQTPWCLALLALSHLQLGRLDRARSHAERALVKAPHGEAQLSSSTRAWIHEVLAATGRTPTLFDGPEIATPEGQEVQRELDRLRAVSHHLQSGYLDDARRLAAGQS